MLVTARWCYGVLLACLLTGCAADVDTRSSDYSGEYVFTPHQDPPAQFADFVVLRPDGVALEVRYSRSSGQITTTQTRWAVAGNTPGQKVIIGDFGHPIEGKGPNSRLFVNYDLDQYYQKVR
jgi:hypothetical protein